jgi:hypothetical protein
LDNNKLYEVHPFSKNCIITRLQAKFSEIIKNKKLEINPVKNLWKSITLLYQEIFLEMRVDWGIFLNKLTENQINIENY